jgi:hypothetical protein
MSKDIKISTPNISVSEILAYVQKYASFSFFVIIALLYIFFIIRVNLIANSEPTEAQISEQTQAIKTLKIDQNSLTKIQNLEDQNIAVQSLFEEARTNPFQD